MENFNLVLSSEEKAVFTLRALYKKYGYSQYKMSKFEEYDLYAKNKNFLVSDNVITFTDTDGKLLALKPDVTLSIVKNDRDGLGVKKLYYNEHVYRVSKGTKSFKEIMQVGLECLGEIDEYAVTEVVYLASKSLDCFSEKNVLDISHLGLVKSVIEYAGVSEDGEKKIIEFIAQKNLEGVRSVCNSENLGEEKTELLSKLITVYGNAEKVLPNLDCFAVSDSAKDGIESLKQVIYGLQEMGVKDKIRIDFSVINDVNYYNGVVFKGFVSGIPTGILSGGQYDNLMNKMGKKSRAIGFAVYLDGIERLSNDLLDDSVDVAIEYGENVCPKEIAKKVNELIKEGKSVIAEKVIPEGINYKTIIKM